MASDGFATADFANALIGLRFQADAIDAHAQCFGQRAAHRREMRAEFWTLADHDGIDVSDGEAAFLKQLASVLEKKQTRRALPFRIGIGKVRANVAEARGAEK